MLSAVVFTPGRTGSFLIVDNLSNYFNGSEIIHTHNPLLVPRHGNFIGIISRRRNIFESILSTAVTSVTQEFKYYTNKKVTPFVFSAKEFRNHYIYYKAFYHLIDWKPFKKVIDVYYEDLTSDPEYLFGLFGERQPLLNVGLKKSPYNYYELIINIEELRELYNVLIQKEITESDINDIRIFVENDLLEQSKKEQS